MKNGILGTCYAITALAGVGLADAATTTGKVNVSVTVTANCVVSSSNLALAYTPGAGPANGNTSLNVSCSAGTNPTTVAFDKGTTAGGSIAQRLAINGATTIQYNLYTSGTYATLLGDGTTGSTASAAGATFAAPKAIAVYGQVPDNATNQAVAAGTYTDTVTATLTF